MTQNDAHTHTHTSGCRRRHYQHVGNSLRRREREILALEYSPPFKKREFFNRGGRLGDRKLVSVSDGGESDSGCSSNNEGRVDPQADVEYSWECPSGLSLLLELMTQSPQRYMGRDGAADNFGMAEAAKVTGRGNYVIAGKAKDFEQNVGIASEGPVVNSNDQHPHPQNKQTNGIDPMNALIMSPTLQEDNAVSQAEQKVAQSKPRYITNFYGEQNVDLDRAHQSTRNLAQGDSILCDLPAFHCQRGERGVTLTQRKIAFDDAAVLEFGQSQTVEDLRMAVRPASPLDQPIDYSQLSSRSKERRESSENSHSHSSHSKIRCQQVDKVFGDIEASKAKLEARHTAEMEIGIPAKSPKYEFILSPKLDRNGNLVLPQASSQNRFFQTDEGSDRLRKDMMAATSALLDASNTASTKNIYAQGVESQISPVSISTTTQAPVFDYRSGVSREKMRCESDPSTSTSNGSHVSAGNSAHREKSMGVYHPKLKYLLAASQYAKQKAEEEEAARHSQHKENFSSNTISTNAESQGENTSAPNECSLHNIEGAQVNLLPSPRHKPEFSHGSDKISSSNSNNNNNFIPQRNDQYSASNNNIPIMSPGVTSVQSHLKGRSDAGITDKGSIFAHPHYSHQQTQNPFHFEFPPSSAIFSDFQISKLHTGSEHSFLRQFETNFVEKIIPSSSSSSSSSLSLSPSSLVHHPKQHNSGLTEILYTGASPISSSSPVSSSPSSPLAASSQCYKPGLDPYECAECGKRYSTSSNLARHRQTHRSVCDKKARKCPHCDKVYVSMPAYSMHVRTHNQGCQCPHCGKKFSRPWLLQGHIRTHTGEKPFACNQCGKSFADKSNLRAHIQTHSTEKPYVCGRCGKAFALKSYLYKHEESSCMRGQRFNRR
ncbi:transcriptional repressor scratch 1 [Plakobranchus ocellatus]|uniref:Transcriptional repressor scratch 1 n=1 Tax=Plakobranchus ocellatus TaxID=259542 RepID=A0AAV4CG92_9GAST|nr:transcriptional repressor scratch 1 [Plakobranchus ocellatus]